MKASFPRYQVSLRKYFVKYIEKQFQERSQVIIEKFKETENVPTDLWTSPQNESFSTVTGHFLNNKFEIEDCEFFQFQIYRRSKIIETNSFGTAESQSHQ